MKIAVIGSGISGLSAAHFLSKKYKVDLFEKNNHFGGHAYTVEIPENDSDYFVSMDLGFIVFNKVKNGEFDKYDNPLKNAPHTHVELTANEWKHKYDRESAAYPSATLKSYKYWPPVARVDNVYGDKNLFCSCPSMDEYKKESAA